MYMEEISYACWNLAQDPTITVMYYDVVLPINLSGINTMQSQHLHLVAPEPSRTDIVCYIIV